MCANIIELQPIRRSINLDDANIVKILRMIKDASGMVEAVNIYTTLKRTAGKEIADIVWNNVDWSNCNWKKYNK